MDDAELLNAFLQARTLLPDPDHCDQKFIVISIGDNEAQVEVSLSEPGSKPVTTFLFKRCRCFGRRSAYQWVCTNPSFQQIIYENELFAALIILNIEN